MKQIFRIGRLLCAGLLLVSCAQEHPSSSKPAPRSQTQGPEQHERADNTTDSLSDQVESCAYLIRGVLYEGSSKQQCDELRSDLNQDLLAEGLDSEEAEVTEGEESPSVSNVEPEAGQAAGNGENLSVICSFNVNGTAYVGKSQAECDKLRKDLGFDQFFTPIPTLPQPPAQQGGQSSYQCSFNINGVLYQGDSKEKCDKLKRDLGFNF